MTNVSLLSPVIIRVFHKMTFLIFRRPKMIEKKYAVLILAVEFESEEKSSLSLLEKKLETSQDKVLEYFQIIEDLNISSDQKDLILFKKALYLIKNSKSEDSVNFINSEVNANNINILNAKSTFWSKSASRWRQFNMSSHSVKSKRFDFVA